MSFQYLTRSCAVQEPVQPLGEELMNSFSSSGDRILPGLSTTRPRAAGAKARVPLGTPPLQALPIHRSHPSALSRINRSDQKNPSRSSLGNISLQLTDSFAVFCSTFCLACIIHSQQSRTETQRYLVSLFSSMTSIWQDELSRTR